MKGLALHLTPNEVQTHLSFYDVLLCLQLLVVGCQFFIEGSLPVYVSGVIGLVSLLYWVIECKSRYLIICVLIIIIIVSLLMLINFILFDNYPFLSIIREPVFGLSSALLILNIKYGRKYYFIIFIVSALFMVYKLSQVGFNLYEENILGHQSRNYVSLYVFIFSLPYYFACARENKRASLIPILFCLVIAFISMGRGNIISAGMWLVLVGFKNLFISNGTKRIWSILLIALVVYGIVFLLTSDSLVTDLLARFEERDAEDDPRLSIWGGYWNKITSSIAYPILGCRLMEIPSLNYYMHLHNSYLMVHCYMGLGGVIILAIGICNSIKSLIKNKYYDLLILILIVLIRASTDWFFPLIQGSVFMWFIILYPMLFSKTRTL